MQQAQDSHDNADLNTPAQAVSLSCLQPPQKGPGKENSWSSSISTGIVSPEIQFYIYTENYYMFSSVFVHFPFLTCQQKPLWKI